MLPRIGFVALTLARVEAVVEHCIDLALTLARVEATVEENAGAAQSLLARRV